MTDCQSTKSAIKRFIPKSIKSLIRGWRTDQIEQQYVQFTLVATFGRVYNTYAWSADDATTPNSSVDSTRRYVVEYCALIEHLLREYNVRTIIYLGSEGQPS